MNHFVEALVENHKAFGMPVLRKPVVPGIHRTQLRIALIKEEFDEFVRASWDDDIVEAADGLVDLLYVVVGAMLEYGLTDIVDQLFNEVQRSNMSKLGADGKPIYNEQGKYMKGPNYRRPDLASIINKAMRKEDDSQLELNLGSERDVK